MKTEIQVFSETGEDHRREGKENEDSVSVIQHGDKIFAVVADGAGSSPVAKPASATAVAAGIAFCQTHPDDIFDESGQVPLTLVYDIQQAQAAAAQKEQQRQGINIGLSQMLCTFMLLAIDTRNRKYVTYHVGDGLIAQINPEGTQIISYPENGATKQITYFVNSPNVHSHLRIKHGSFSENDSFFIGTDGCFEHCYRTDEKIKRVNELDKITDCKDDATYCIIQ